MGALGSSAGTLRHGRSPPRLSPRVAMGADAKDVALVNHVNTWFWPSFTLVGTSSLFFGVYIGRITNSHEWKELFLDYCHHKRTSHSPNPLDKVARTFMRLLKIAPK